MPKDGPKKHAAQHQPPGQNHNEQHSSSDQPGGHHMGTQPPHARHDDSTPDTSAATANASAETAELQRQIGQLTEALQRERADATNLRRRHDEQIGGLRLAVKAGVVRDLLPVIDNFERALKHVPKDLEDNDFVKGVQGVVKQFEKTLADIGVQRIKTAGEAFDPAVHEAVAMDEGDGSGGTEVVSEELQAGYKIGDEVIRHAMVRVTLA